MNNNTNSNLSVAFEVIQPLFQWQMIKNENFYKCTLDYLIEEGYGIIVLGGHFL